MPDVAMAKMAGSFLNPVKLFEMSVPNMTVRNLLGFILIAQSQSRGEELCVGDLGHRLGISRSAATRLTQSIGEMDLIGHMEDEYDQRRKLLVLRDAGKLLFRQMMYSRAITLAE
jgi:DNA-binding MarR family transcriptional regulator